MDSKTILTSTESLQIENSSWTIIDPATKDSAWMITQKVPDVTWAEVLNYFTFETVGTDVPTSIIPIPANSFAAYELGRIWDRYTTWIALAVTWAIWATDTTNAVAWVYVKTNYI